MSIQRKDENGIYRDYDPNTGRFLDGEYPLGSSLGQVEHQMQHTSAGRVVDLDEKQSDILDETGLAIISEDESKIKSYVKGAISVDNLVETFNDNSHETLLKLLALQDNKHPLKKGGIGIAYRTDALIMHCKMEFSAEENVVFDAILGTISSFPSDKTYKIEPGSFLKFSKYKVENTMYDVFRKGTNKLKDRHLMFENLGPDGEDDIVVPWFDILRYHKKGKNNDVAYIEFKPSDFFKDLALCSGLVHGAFGSLEVTTQLQGKYTIALYWFLENMKNYREYPNATPGLFDISTEELKHQFSIPETYQKADIERRVLKPAYESINSISECDFTFEYEPKKVNNKHVGYSFRVKNKNYIDTTARDIVEIEKKEIDPIEEQIKNFLKFSGAAFSEEELDRIYQISKKFNRDAGFMLQAAGVLKTRLDNNSLDKIESPIAYLITLIKNGSLMDAATLEKDYNTTKKSFSNYKGQRDYDWDSLERVLLGQ